MMMTTTKTTTINHHRCCVYKNRYVYPFSCVSFFFRLISKYKCADEMNNSTKNERQQQQRRRRQKQQQQQHKKKLYSVKYLYKTHLVDRRNSYSREQSGETRQIDNGSMHKAGMKCASENETGRHRTNEKYKNYYVLECVHVMLL